MSKQRTIIKGGIHRGGNVHYTRNSVIYIFENICFAWQFFFEFCLPQIKAENIHNKLEAVIVFFIIPQICPKKFLTFRYLYCHIFVEKFLDYFFVVGQ